MTTLWRSFWKTAPLSHCWFPPKISGLEVFLIDLSFKEDYAIGEQQQNLLLFHGPWSTWMVCYLQGDTIYVSLPKIILIWGVLERSKEWWEGFLSSRRWNGSRQPLRSCTAQRHWGGKRLWEHLDEYIEHRDGAFVISHASLTGKRKASS